MNKKLTHFIYLVMLLSLVISLVPFSYASRTRAQEDELVWPAWENKDITTLGDDNSGSTLAVSDDVLSPAGNPILQVTPSGTSEETSVAFPVAGADLADWVSHERVELEAYLPEDSALNANKFFIVMGDVTGD